MSNLVPGAFFRRASIAIAPPCKTCAQMPELLFAVFLKYHACPVGRVCGGDVSVLR